MQNNLLHTMENIQTNLVNTIQNVENNLVNTVANITVSDNVNPYIKIIKVENYNFKNKKNDDYNNIFERIDVETFNVSKKTTFFITSKRSHNIIYENISINDKISNIVSVEDNSHTKDILFNTSQNAKFTIFLGPNKIVRAVEHINSTTDSIILFGLRKNATTISDKSLDDDLYAGYKNSNGEFIVTSIFNYNNIEQV